MPSVTSHWADFVDLSVWAGSKKFHKHRNQRKDFFCASVTPLTRWTRRSIDIRVAVSPSTSRVYSLVIRSPVCPTKYGDPSHRRWCSRAGGERRCPSLSPSIILLSLSMPVALLPMWRSLSLSLSLSPSLSLSHSLAVSHTLLHSSLKQLSLSQVCTVDLRSTAVLFCFVFLPHLTPILFFLSRLPSRFIFLFCATH